MEKMQRGEAPGPSEQGFSKELVEMLAKQERIRMALKEFENSLVHNTYNKISNKFNSQFALLIDCSFLLMPKQTLSQTFK